MPRRVNPQDYLVADSPVMRGVVREVEAFSKSEDPVLICGEIGTGRELIARVLHCRSRRQGSGFVSIRAQLAPRALAYDPHLCTARGTLRAADHGTLLIRDIGDVPMSSQVQLLDLIANRESDRSAEYDVRVMGTCDPELGVAADAGFFHQKLYNRLAEKTVQVPPLRKRIEDIPILYEQFVRQYATELGRGRMTVSSRVHDRLTAYPWPGNVSELKSIARRMVARAGRGQIEPGDLDAVLPVVAERVPLENLSFEEMVKSKLVAFLQTVDGYPVRGLYEEVLARVERPLLALVMDRTGGNQVRAAEILGLNRNTLRRKLSERGLLVRSKTLSRSKPRN